MALNSSTAILAILAPLATAPVWANDMGQQAPAPDAAYISDNRNPDTILVSAVRQSVPLTQIPASVTVLDKTAIDRAQDLGVTELLARTPGVSFVRNGGYGTSTTLRIRGGEAGQTVLVVDGVKMNDPSNTDCSYNFGNLLLGDVAQIEVLRGVQSTLWGSSAIGGVVNVITAMPQKELEGSFDLEYGSRETVSGRAAVGGKTGPVSWRIGAQSFTTAGISAIAPAFGGEEKDPYSHQSVQGRVLVELTSNLSLDFRGHYANGRVDFDDTSGDSPVYGDTKEFIGYAGLNWDLLEGRFRNRISYGYTQTDRENYDPRRERLLNYDAMGKNQRFEYQGTFAITSDATALFGAEHEKSSFRSVSPPASLAVPIPQPIDGEASLTGVYGQLHVQPLSGLTLTAGLRHDDHDRYGGKTLLSAGAVWNLPTGTTLRATYGEGFKAPSLYQLFSEYGYVGLAPEKASDWEVGVEQKLFDNKLSLGAAWFERTSSNLIIYVGCSGGSTDPLCYIPGTTTSRWGYYDNVSKAQSQGLEVQAALDLGALHIEGNYSRIVSEDRSADSANFGNWLPRRPQEMANASVNYELPFGLQLGSSVRWSGKSYDNANNRLRLDPYTLVDVRAELEVSPEVRVFARVENLFDAEYMTANRYGTLGRSLYVGLRGRF